MNILNVMQCTNLGGMERASLLLMKALEAKGHAFEVLSLNVLGKLKPLLDEAGIASRGLEYRGVGGWASWRAMRNAIRQTHADALIMTGHNLMFMLAMGRFCAPRRILCIHFHHLGVKPLWQWRLIYRMACLRFRTITFPSDFVRREAETIYGRLRERTATIRNPIPLPPRSTKLERLRARERLDLPAEAKVVGGAGWLIHRKRWDVFLQVASHLATRMPELFVIIAGDGPERERLRERIVALGLEPRVRLLGWQTDLRSFYQAIDLLLFHSDYDAYPTVPQEAMSFGVPVVASAKYSGLAEVLNSPEVGVLLQDHAISTLTDRALDLLTNPSRSEAVAEHARRRIAETADPEEVARQFDALLNR